MTQEETKKLQIFETHFRMLMEKYTQLKAENAELYDMVDQKDAALKELQMKNEELQTLLAMTPHFWRIKKENREKLEKISELTLTAHFWLRVLRKL